MPDICGSLEDPTRSSAERYKDWFSRHLSGTYAAWPSEPGRLLCTSLRFAARRRGAMGRCQVRFPAGPAGGALGVLPGPASMVSCAPCCWSVSIVVTSKRSEDGEEAFGDEYDHPCGANSAVHLCDSRPEGPGTGWGSALKITIVGLMALFVNLRADPVHRPVPNRCGEARMSWTAGSVRRFEHKGDEARRK
jgi:hypothetical protein